MSAGDPRAPRRPHWIAGEKECRDLAAADSAEERTGLGAARGHLLDDYGTALVACSDPDDALACHYAATHPKRHAGEELSDAVDRAHLAFRPAAAHHCQPAAAARFWAFDALRAPPPPLGPPGCLPPPGDVTRRGCGPPGGPTLRQGEGLCYHGPGPVPACAAAGLRWRGPAGARSITKGRQARHEIEVRGKDYIPNFCSFSDVLPFPPFSLAVGRGTVTEPRLSLRLQRKRPFVSSGGSPLHVPPDWWPLGPLSPQPAL